MRSRFIFIFVSFFLVCASPLWAQRWNIVKKDNDTIPFSTSQIIITKDTVFFSATDTFAILKNGTKYRIRKNPYTKSEVFYDSLRVKSYKNKITEELYHLVFRTTPIEVHDTSNFDKSENIFAVYQGRTIKSIRLKNIDVIEGSIYDTLVTAQSFLGKGANNIHVNSSKRIIYNSLTFNKGDKIDAHQFADNERILRSAPYIEDARINVIPDSEDSTQADILILIKDEFSIGVGGDYGGFDNFKLTLYDKNFLGIGHDMRHSLIYRSGYQPQYGYGFRYGINNISKSFISARVEYENSWDKQLIMLKVDKVFLSPQTKYAGGLSIYEIADSREYNYDDTVSIVPYRAILQDYWIGRAFPVSKYSRTRINASVRYAVANFSERPLVSQDSNFFYHDGNLILGELSLMRRNYYKSSLVLGFGVTEDIPYGFVISLITGIDRDQFIDRPYFGGGIVGAKHYKRPGYLLASLSFGSFYNNGTVQDGVIKLKLLNIGNLHRMRRYSIRNFASMNFQYGIQLSDPDSKTQLNDRWTSIVSGLNKDGLKGTQKVSINLESALFTPWYLFGFKFSLFAFSDLGWVSSDKDIGKNMSFYTSLGGGLRVKNESWVFETITLGFAFFARAPDGSSRLGFILDASDPKLFNNLILDKPRLIKMDQSPQLFID